MEGENSSSNTGHGEIIVYNMHTEEHTGINSFDISRNGVLGNPYTHLKKDKSTKNLIKVKSREKAIELYSVYFDLAYEQNEVFRAYIDVIYNMYKSGETVYLGCWCHPKPCHGDIIKEKLQKRLIMEKVRDAIQQGKNMDCFPRNG